MIRSLPLSVLSVATLEAFEQSLTQSGFSFTPGFNRVTGLKPPHRKNRFVVAARKPLKRFGEINADGATTRLKPGENENALFPAPRIPEPARKSRTRRTADGGMRTTINHRFAALVPRHGHRRRHRSRVAMTIRRFEVNRVHAAIAAAVAVRSQLR